MDLYIQQAFIENRSYAKTVKPLYQAELRRFGSKYTEGKKEEYYKES